MSAPAQLLPPLVSLVARTRHAVRRGGVPHAVVADVEAALGSLLAETAVLTPAQRAPGGATYRQHLLHVDPDTNFSVVSLVWRPGQATPIHDHRCWCVVGVLEGREREVRFEHHTDGTDEWLTEQATTVNGPGSTSVLVPPDPDIHRVSNGGDGIAISLHVYGANLAECSSSIRRTYGLPVRAGRPCSARRPADTAQMSKLPTLSDPQETKR